MIELQRASAGSGKTFALAKKFIWYFITIKTDPDTPDDEPGFRRLRTHAELNDSLSHIMAVTFTNKATNEMQQRIVTKLAALADASPGPLPGTKDPDYLTDFITDLAKAGEHVTRSQLRDTCRYALSVLLNNYSDFHVSTIDSFFQQILRTFAYESDINDSYQVEIDSNLIASMAVDTLLEQLNSGTASDEVRYWVRVLMDRNFRNNEKWNIFQKPNGATPGNGTSLYQDLISSVNKLENEEFKEKRAEIDSYFRKYPDLRSLYEHLGRQFGRLPEKAFDNYRKALADLERAAAAVPADTDRKNFCKPLFYMRGENLSGTPDPTRKPYRFDRVEAGDVDYLRNTASETLRTQAYMKRAAKSPGEYAAAEQALDKALDAAREWLGILLAPPFSHWVLYRKNIPFLGLLRALLEVRENLLAENNAVQLSETNSLLRGIIDNDSTPFIYERLGTHLRHFLIDEFQDTSKMQWENIAPLLDSFINGNGSLIIGDPKQSIYRFRNADSSLISHVVPEHYGIGGSSPAEERGKESNTNWRSSKNVVLFNNTFFRWLAAVLSQWSGGGRDFNIEYSNVVQHPHKKEETGYVEIMTVRNAALAFEAVPHIISEALARGYRMRDIAVLTSTNTAGAGVIEAIMEYNAGADPVSRIEFVSEESLKLSSSEAVSYVMSVLRTIARGAAPETRHGDEARVRGSADWFEIRSSVQLYMLDHPEMAPHEALARFIDDNDGSDAVAAMLQAMQCVSLPALVEAIAGRFCPERLRHTDAVFLAALQDAVIEYCEHNPSDIASFLKWWDMKGAGRSISSPEGTDAVQVMTIHKSKGLEFKVVISPDMNQDFGDKAGKAEWRWVIPSMPDIGTVPLPPYIPVDTVDALADTAHAGVLAEFYDMKRADSLNLAYVDFTRAIDELYIISRQPPKSLDTGKSLPMGYLLTEFMNGIALGTIDTGDSPGLMSGKLAAHLSFESDESVFHGLPTHYVRERKNKGSVVSEICENIDVYTYGRRPDRAADSRLETETEQTAIIGEYRAADKVDFIEFVNGAAPDIIEAEDFDEETDADPRSIGNLMHAVMENVETAGDLEQAVRRFEISGVLDNETAGIVRGMLRQALDNPRVSAWFDGSMRVLAERPILRPESDRRSPDMPRPDRIMVTAEGDAVVVDYKFGESHGSDERYRRQVAGYAGLLRRSGMFRSVRGYLWYVRLGEIVTVE